MDLFLLVLFVGFAVGVSFLCSLLEATLFSSRVAYLSDRASKGSRGCALLLEAKRTRIDDAISAILVLNTVSNTLGATLAGAQAARVFGSAWVGLFSGVLTLMILIISEIIPKTLGAVYAQPLSAFVGFALQAMTRILRPVLYLSGMITRLLTRDRATTFSRTELSALITVATTDGILSTDEARMLASLLRFHEIKVEDVMTPRTVVFMLPSSATVARLLEEPEARVFSRIPLFDSDRDHVIGYILQREVLRALAEHGDRNRPLSDFMRPVSFVPELATLPDALRHALKQREPLAMATDEHGGVSGLVTLEDMTETMLGVEIVDESDRIVDLREAAARIRQERLDRLQRMRQLRLGRETPDQEPPEG